LDGREVVTMTVELRRIHGGEPGSGRAEQVNIPMRDGVRLATDVYLPARPSRHPAVLVRTPHDKAGRQTALGDQARHYCERGYVLVAQDVRGKYRSGGQTLPYHFDVQDAYDTIDWIIGQPWSDQTVGLTGAGYCGATAWAAVAGGHPAVRAAVPRNTGVDMAADHVASMWTQRPPHLLGLHDLIQGWSAGTDFVIDVDYGSAPVTELLKEAEALVGHSLPVADLLKRARTGEYYNPYGGRHPWYTTNVPILHGAAWGDLGLASSGMADWRHFRALPGLRDLHFLSAGFVEADADADAECEEIVDFFDEHVRGIRPENRRPRARWSAGSHAEFSSEEWPPTAGRDQILFLAVGAGQSGVLSGRRDARVRTLRWIHDPDDPVPSSGAFEDIGHRQAVPADERQLALRSDVLTFTSAPLSEPLDIAGRPVLRAEITSTGPSSHLFAVLQDVEPGGAARPVSRADLVRRSGPGEPILLPLGDVAHRFRPGHRVRLQLRSSDFPRFLVHPGTDENPWFATTRVAAEQSVRTGGTAAASLTLPVLESRPRWRAVKCYR
jgi:predicted acyl esterase